MHVELKRFTVRLGELWWVFLGNGRLIIDGEPGCTKRGSMLALPRPIELVQHEGERERGHRIVVKMSPSTTSFLPKVRFVRGFGKNLEIGGNSGRRRSRNYDDVPAPFGFDRRFASFAIVARLQPVAAWIFDQLAPA